ncbi:hypothetical protein SKAU_G00029220 [Synaphobranchus kaupii]|uniref:Ubiquitin-like domain-containing protein n=1 Tax=Synaphobranchus kaupii TaxID=118154 RepID=A0A9Q1GDG3_SYNKA|nr:hypothetical protein SKAU_G00029220 [Synaphobranchus kaupii]
MDQLISMGLLTQQNGQSVTAGGMEIAANQTPVQAQLPEGTSNCQPPFSEYPLQPTHRSGSEAGSETEIGTSADTMSPMATVDPLENLKDVERINIWVKSQGKSVEIDVFPLERVSVLLQDSCQKMEKDPLKMMLIYKGEKMDEMKTVQEYRLRGGVSVQLVRCA